MACAQRTAHRAWRALDLLGIFSESLSRSSSLPLDPLSPKRDNLLREVNCSHWTQGDRIDQAGRRLALRGWKGHESAFHLQRVREGLWTRQQQSQNLCG